MKRRYLRPTKFGRKSNKFYVFDIETGKDYKDGTGRIEYFLSARPENFIFGAVYGPDGFCKVIHSVKEFQREFLKKRYKNKIVYAHNAEYDLSGIFDNIYLMDPGAVFNGKFVTCTNGNCKFADSFNLLPTSVKKLGELIGLNKQRLGQVPDKDGRLWSSHKTFDLDVEYCITDCKIVYDSLYKLFEFAEPSFTIGSLSLKIFRADFLHQSIKVNTIADHFFECLYGGRTEAFKIGKVKARVYDINSAYPEAMRNLRFPDPGRLRRVKCKDFNQYLSEKVNNDYYRYEGMITATITIPDYINIPMLPYRTEDKLLFPVGTFTGSWTLNEFRYAYFNYPITLHRVHDLIIAESIPSPFKDYIEHYYQLRLNTDDEFEKYYYKLFMNNLYGKLIQKTREEYRFCKDIQAAKDFIKQRRIKRVELIEVKGGYFLKYDVNKIHSHTIPCWGAYITAHVRVKLHKGIMECPEHTVYVDTDSRFVEKDLPLNSKKLGGWKKETKIVTLIRTLKDYICIEDGKEKHYVKGVKKGSKQLTPGADVFQVKRMVKTRESFRRKDDLPPGTFINQLKVLTGDYSKRRILKDGSTKPFKLSL